MDLTKMDQSELGSPCQELSKGGLGIVAALSLFSGIIFLLAHIGRPIQLYSVNTNTKMGSFE